MPGFPLVDGVVNAIEPDGAGGYYIAGIFSRVGGEPRGNLAHLLADGTVDPAFAPVVDGSEITSMALGNSALFIGGVFGTVNGAPRNRFAALNPATGATTAFSPPPLGAMPRRILVSGANVILVLSTEFGGSRVTALNQATAAVTWTTELSGSLNDAVIAGARLIVGGGALQSDGRTVASLDVSTGAIDPTWAPSGLLQVNSPDVVTALAVSGNTLYVGGTFAQFGGQPRTHAAAVDIPAAAVTMWTPNPNGPVSTLAVGPATTVFLGGAFTQVDGQPRETFAEVDAAGGVSTWIADVSASTVQALRVDAAGTLLIGGQTGVSGGSARTNLAAFDLSADTLLTWAPATSDDVTALAAIGTTVYIGASRR